MDPKDVTKPPTDDEQLTAKKNPQQELPPLPTGEEDGGGAAASQSSSSDEEGEEEEGDISFPDDAAADTLRAEAVALYNTGSYGAALDRQYRIVRHFAGKYGPTSAKAAKYFLDYALSQLRALQSQSTVEDVLQPRDEDALEGCFINLEMARVGLQKAEDALNDAETPTAMTNSAAYVEVSLMMAETHNALAQLSVEKEDYDAALKEYEAELLVYRGLQETEEEESEYDGEEDTKASENTNNTDTRLSVVPPGRLVAALFGVADCFAKEGDFAGAEERLRATLEEVAAHPAGTFPADLIEELEEMLEDATEMKGGKFEELREEIGRQFTAQAADAVPTAGEFFSGDAGDAAAAAGGGRQAHTVMDGKGGQRSNPFVSAVPGAGKAAGGAPGAHAAGGGEGSRLSMPLSGHGAVLGFGNHNADAMSENSNSVSLFPPQNLSRSGAPVDGGGSNTNSRSLHTAVAVTKKAKIPMGPSSASCSQSGPPEQPEAKKARTEE